MNADAPAEAPARSHPLAMQIGYSAANLGKSVVWNSFESIMLFYLVSVGGFPPLVGGALLAATLLWDAAFDLIVARWTDRSNGGGRLGRLIVVGAPLCGIGFWLAFALHAPGPVAAAIIACRLGYSLCDVGHNTLLIRVASAPGDAARVSGMRLLFSAGGVALVALASGSSLAHTLPEAQRASFAVGALCGGLLYVATLFGALYATRGLKAPQASADVRPDRPLHYYARDAAFRRLLCVIAFQAALVPLFQRALPFYGKAVHADPSWAGPALLTITLSQSLTLPLWMAASRRLPPRTIAMGAHGAAIAAMAGLTLTPASIAEPSLLVGLGASFGGMNLAIWALLTDIVQRTLREGAGGEATPVGLFLATLKVAAALGNFLFSAIVAAGPVALAWRLLPGGSLLTTSATALPVCGSLAAGALLYSMRDPFAACTATKPGLAGRWRSWRRHTAVRHVDAGAGA